MLPFIEIESLLALFGAIVIIICKLYYCYNYYEYKMLSEILLLGIATTFIWMFYFYYRSRTKLAHRFFIFILMYFCVFIWIQFKLSKKINSNHKEHI